METTIYMPLLGEGTDCWRPVHAMQVSVDLFEVVEQIPEDESWAFAPGARIRCKNQSLSTGETGLVPFEYAVESNPHYRLLKSHERRLFRIIFAGGEEVVAKVLHVDEPNEDFIYDLVSTNLDRERFQERKDAVFVRAFADVVSAQLCE